MLPNELVKIYPEKFQTPVLVFRARLRVSESIVIPSVAELVSEVVHRKL